jgi:hypothetical protein
VLERINPRKEKSVFIQTSLERCCECPECFDSPRNLHQQGHLPRPFSDTVRYLVLISSRGLFWRKQAVVIHNKPPLSCQTIDIANTLHTSQLHTDWPVLVVHSRRLLVIDFQSWLGFIAMVSVLRGLWVDQL